RAISQARDAGAAVVCASSDYEQLATICDRVLIFSRGRVIGELAGEQVDKDSIAEQCYRSVRSVLHSERDGRAA
ncbi:MAG: hypothetical protein MI824_17280, partial [Hyphomicrobiales bacterium]|nr:hypothetical protein [Hyphomicrobiales bacterium]